MLPDRTTPTGKVVFSEDVVTALPPEQGGEADIRRAELLVLNEEEDTFLCTNADCPPQALVRDEGVPELVLVALVDSLRASLAQMSGDLLLLPRRTPQGEEAAAFVDDARVLHRVRS